MFEVVLFSSELILDDEGVAAGKISDSARVQFTTFCKKKLNFKIYVVYLPVVLNQFCHGGNENMSL
jgi:hypothetical protein